ncbi:MAG: VCBS repeat-containing protein [bacterium]|nr:VCBS repeat-containing protein [bacterium]
MRSKLFTILCVVVLAPFAGFAQDPLDPGVVDTFRFMPTTLVVGESRPVDIWFWNDETITAFQNVFTVASGDGGFARVDSLVFAGRLGDPSMLNDRTVNLDVVDGVSTDTIIVLALKSARGNNLVAGEGVLYQLYMTGLVPGEIILDSLHWIESINLDFVVGDGQFTLFHPYFRPATLQVVEETAPLVLSLPSQQEPVTIGDMVGFSVAGPSAPSDSAIVTLTSLTLVDDDSHFAQTSPIVSGTNPLEFDWTPGAQDIGIWKASFEVSGSQNRTTSGQVQIQVVASEDYLVQFTSNALDNTEQALGMTHGDCDGDGRPEVVVAGSGWPNSYAVYEFQNDLEEVSSVYDGYHKRGPQLGYFNDDDTLDLVMYSTFGLLTYYGNGDNTFTKVQTYDDPTASGYSTDFFDFDGNGHLDLVASDEDGFVIYPGAAGGTFLQEIQYLTEDSALSVTSADFNGDGWDDVAVGTVSGLEIFLHDGQDSLISTFVYTQTFGARDIQVTNQGSDVNNDGRFDLCLSTPSIGGANSDLMLYLGNADGSFGQHLVRTVNGQIFANCLGDFNNDTDLDIAYVNGTKKYVGILFGDGTGAFANELRYPVPSFTPFMLDAMDIDTDGDIDVVVSSYQIYDTAVMYCYLNQTDPGMLAKRFEVRATDKARLEITAPDGARLDELKQVIPASAYYERSLNGNSALDIMTSISVIEPGGYLLTVEPRANDLESDNFSLSYQVNSDQYSIAREIPLPVDGYRFMVYPDGASPIQPALGAYVASPSPHFSWPNSGTVLFQLAIDPTFATIIDSATVTGGSYTTDLSLADDSTCYYWRVVEGQGAEAMSGFNSFTIVPVPTGADDEGNSGLPTEYVLYPNYPNPFNPSTTIMYDLPRAGHVKLEVYNILGQEIVTLVDAVQSAGSKQIVWNGRDAQNNPVTTGVYLYRLTAANFQAVGKMLLLK